MPFIHDSGYTLGMVFPSVWAAAFSHSSLYFYDNTTINNAYNTSSVELYQTQPKSGESFFLFFFSIRAVKCVHNQDVNCNHVSVNYDLHQDSYRPCTYDNIISQERYQITVIILELSYKENVVNYVKYFIFFRV